MLCFRDMTFCPFHKDCLDAKKCSRPLTEKVIKDAETWWGGSDAPIAVFTEKPNCHRTQSSSLNRE